jgi:hypothetical protein
MRVSNLDFSESEAESLRTLAIANGHDPDSLTPPNLVRAALGLELRKRGGPRKSAKEAAPSGEPETGRRGGRRKKSGSETVNGPKRAGRKSVMYKNVKEQTGDRGQKVPPRIKKVRPQGNPNFRRPEVAPIIEASTGRVVGSILVKNK